MVEKQDMDSCSVLGGQQMILTGQNFSADSKVIFTEKTHGKWHHTQEVFQNRLGSENCHYYYVSLQIMFIPLISETHRTET